MCRWCTEFLSSIWDRIWTPVSDWVSKTFRNCSRQRCRWWCLCCNKWLCWLVAILVAVIVFIVTLVLAIITAIVCAICIILCPIICVAALLSGKVDLDRCLKWCSGEETSPGDTSVNSPTVTTEGGLPTPDDGTGPARPGSGTGPSGLSGPH